MALDKSKYIQIEIQKVLLALVIISLIVSIGIINYNHRRQLLLIRIRQIDNENKIKNLANELENLNYQYSELESRISEIDN